jgi:molecular chaperone GrpE (heat shock protein)
MKFLSQNMATPPTTPGLQASDVAQGLQSIEHEMADLMKRLAESQATHREAEETGRRQQCALFCELIEASDAFERVFALIEKRKAECTPQMNVWVGNFRLVYRLLWRTLKSQGIARIENLDGMFDPHWQLAVIRVYDPERPEGTILREEKPGYVWRGLLLRKTEVTVITHTPAETGEREPENKAPNDA